jgi:hypothetical protein
MDIKSVSSISPTSSQSNTKPSDNSLSELQQQKKSLNTAILQANADVSLSSGNNSLSLLYKTALEGINEALEAEFGPNSIEASVNSELDVSPQATADRIVSQSTGFFAAFAEQNPDLTEQEALTKFTNIISSGIDKGFSEARDILEGLSVLQGEIADNIDQTYRLVQSGLSAFIEQFGQTKEGE